MKFKSLLTAFIFLTISFLFWGAISLNNEYTTEIYVPFKLINESKDSALDEEVPSYLRLKIKASGWNILRIKFDKDIGLSINLNNYANTTTLSLRDFISTDYNFPPETRILDVQPSSVRLIRRKSFEKFVYVYPNLNIKCRDGYEIVSEIKTSPKQILIRGTYNLLQKIDTIFTKPIVLNDVYENVNLSVPIQDTLVNSIFYEKKNIDVSFRVELIVDKVFPQIPVVIKNVPISKNIIIEPQDLTVTLRGGIVVLSELNPDDIKAEIDYSKLENQTIIKVKPEISLPYGIKLINYKPEEFLIRVE